MTVVAPGFVETELQGHNTDPVVVRALSRSREQIGEVLQPEDIADAIVHAVTRPPHVCINEVVVRPTDAGSLSRRNASAPGARRRLRRAGRTRRMRSSR